MPDFRTTGIQTLDKLLGGDGIPVGSSVLIQGGHGTGKTTLAIQMAKSFHGERREGSIIWISSNQSPEAAITQISESLLLHDVNEPATRFWMQPEFKLVDAANGLDVMYDGQQAGARHDVGGQEGPGSVNKLTEYLETLLAATPPPQLVIIDDLEALVRCVKRRWDEVLDDRDAILAVLDLFASDLPTRKPTIVVFISESGSHSERCSCVVDIVIELDYEHLSHLLPTEFDDDVKGVEWRERLMRCSVTKGRGLPIQRRSSCYEFVKKHGLKFYPTYASPGLVCLFHENRPQTREINRFRHEDIPRQFPRVIVQGFHRSGMQRMFAIQRYQQRIPLRHPLVLGSVDEYWIRYLAEAGKLLCPLPPEEIKLYSLKNTESQDSNDTQVIEEIARKHVGDRSPQDWSSFYRDQQSKFFLAIPYMANVGMMVYRKDVLDAIGVEPPDTWEQLEAICEQLKKKGLPNRFLLETRTYDTFVATALELCWGEGVKWRTQSDPQTGALRVEYLQGDFALLVKAIERLKRWIHECCIVPVNSTVESQYLPAPAYLDALPRGIGGRGQAAIQHSLLEDWVFARHWYSTWVDTITYIDGSHKPPRRIIKPENRSKYGFCRLPIARAQHEAGQPHCTTWGEWYLALQTGSENIELGIELINNLMTSRKITERANAGAGLPTVRRFYETAGEQICYGTNLTFNEIRKTFFQDARSRIDFDNYIKVARVFSGAIKAVASNPKANVRQLLERAMTEIERP